MCETRDLELIITTFNYFFMYITSGISLLLVHRVNCGQFAC